MTNNQCLRLLGVSKDTLVLSLCAREFKTTYQHYEKNEFFTKAIYKFTCLNDVQVEIVECVYSYRLTLSSLTLFRESLVTDLDNLRDLRSYLQARLGCKLDLFGV
jgi:hypothetical protein